MEIKSASKNKSLDYVVLVFASLVFVFSMVCIKFEDRWISKFLTAKQQTSKSIGHITATASGIKRKPLGDVLWAAFQQDTSVFNGDKIFTDKGVTTQVVLQNTGTQIKMEPESLIQLHEDEMNLESGDFELKLTGNKPTVIRSGTNRITVSSKQGVIKLRQNKHKTGVEVSVLEGNVDISAKGKKENIEKGRKVDIDQSGKIISKASNEIPLKAFYPKDKQALKFIEPQAISFLWQHKDTADEYTLEVADNIQFTKPLLTTTTKTPQYEFNNITSGKYYWRAKINEKGLEVWSKSSFFTVAIAKPAEAVKEVVKEEPKVAPRTPASKPAKAKKLLAAPKTSNSSSFFEESD